MENPDRNYTVFESLINFPDCYFVLIMFNPKKKLSIDKVDKFGRFDLIWFVEFTRLKFRIDIITDNIGDISSPKTMSTVFQTWLRDKYFHIP